MGARQAVLLTPSKCSGLPQLLFYKQSAPVSPLFATLRKSAHLYDSTTFSRPLFSYSYALFCTMEKRNSFISNRFHTLLQKHGGCMGCAHAPLLKKNFKCENILMEIKNLLQLMKKIRTEGARDLKSSHRAAGRYDLPHFPKSKNCPILRNFSYRTPSNSRMGCCVSATSCRSSTSSRKRAVAS